MIKILFLFTVFGVILSFMKPMPSYKTLGKDLNIVCKDICK